jgi:hypothetical protein
VFDFLFQIKISFRIKFSNTSIFFSKEENETYKNRLANGNNDWIGSRSTSALNGRATPLSAAGKTCLMMQ